MGARETEGQVGGINAAVRNVIPDAVIPERTRGRESQRSGMAIR